MPDPTRDSPPGPAPTTTLTTLRSIGLALGAGVTLFAVVTWVIHARGAPPRAGQDAALFVNVWLLLAAGAAVASVVLWRRNVAPLIARPQADAPRRDPRSHAAALMTGVIICWSLIEGAALFGVVVYFLFGDQVAGVASVAFMWVALGLTWPKPHWVGDRTGGSLR